MKGFSSGPLPGPLPGLLRTLAMLSMALLGHSAMAQTDILPLVRAQCAVCHGERGESAHPEFPQLAGQHAVYLRKQLQDFQSGARRHEAMNTIARSLSAAQVQQLAEHFARQPAQPQAADDELLVQMGRYIYERGNLYNQVPACKSCHSSTGVGNERMPRLAGQHPRYIETQLRRFQSRQRHNDSGAMAFVTQGLSELELRGVSAYVATLDPVVRPAGIRRQTP
jgi:cytochrome c553